jgi:hypothetical protein
MYKDKYLKYKYKYFDLIKNNNQNGGYNSINNNQNGGYTLKYNIGDQVYINGKIMTTTDLHNPTQWNTKEIMANNIIGYILSIYRADTMDYNVYTIKITDELYIPEILEDKISIYPSEIAYASAPSGNGVRNRPNGPNGPNDLNNLSYCSKTMMLRYKFNEIYKDNVMNKTIHKCRHILPSITPYYFNGNAYGFILSSGRVEFGTYDKYVYYLCAVNNISDFELLTIKNSVDMIIEESRYGEFLNNNNQSDFYINRLITQFNPVNQQINQVNQQINPVNQVNPNYYNTNTNTNKFVNSLLSQKSNLDKLSDEEDFDEYLKKLRKLMTKFYYRETEKWLEKDKAFLQFKKIKNKITANYIKEILKEFIKISKDKKNEVFWHELNSDELYDDVKDFIKSKISKLVSKKSSKKSSKK